MRTIRRLPFPFARVALACVAITGAAILAAPGPGAAAGQGSGEGGRHRVNPMVPPWSSVGRLNNAIGQYCTGVLVDPRIVLTAAHCLYSTRTGHFVQPGSVHFLLGYDKGDYEFHSPARALHVADGYDPTRPLDSLSSDWALVELETPAPGEFAPMPIDDAAPAAGTLFRAVGFASSRRYVMTSTGTCTTLGNTRAGLLAASCEVAHGYSGGPLISEASDALIGIQAAGGNRNGKAYLLGVAVAAWRGALERLRRDAGAPLTR